MKYHVSMVPRVIFSLGTIFSLSAAHLRTLGKSYDNVPWENITLLAVHRNVIFHDRPGQYVNNILQKQKAKESTIKIGFCIWKFSLNFGPYHVCAAFAILAHLSANNDCCILHKLICS